MVRGVEGGVGGLFDAGSFGLTQSMAGEIPIDADVDETRQAVSSEVAAQEEAVSVDAAEATEPKPGLKKKAVRGGAWTIGAYGGSQFIRFGSNIVLARILAPDDFGLMGLVTIVLIGLQMFSDIGIGPAIIQNKRQDARFVNTAWTLQVVRGFVLWGVAALLAIPLSRWWEGPDGQLDVILPIAAMTAAIQGFQSTNWFTANRNLAVKWMMLIELFTLTAQAVTMIVWAYAVDASVWALVAGSLVMAVLHMGLSHLLPGVRNRFCLDKQAASELIHFGKWLFVSTIITFLAMQSDKLLLQSFTDVATFGIFWIGVQLAMLGPMLSMKLGQTIGFPALSEVHRERPERFYHTLWRVRLSVVGMIYVVLFGLIALGPALFYTLYRVEYWGAGWVVQIIAINSLAGMLNTSYSYAYLSTGRTFFNTATVTAQWILVTVCCCLGYYLQGDTGFLLGLAASQWLKYPVDAYLAAKQNVWQWKLDFSLLFAGTAISLLMLWVSYATTPMFIALGEDVRVWIESLKTMVKSLGGVA